jgi:hypothetical protein
MRGIHRLQMRLGGPDSSQHVWTSRNDSDSNARYPRSLCMGLFFEKLSSARRPNIWVIRLGIGRRRGPTSSTRTAVTPECGYENGSRRRADDLNSNSRYCRCVGCATHASLNHRIQIGFAVCSAHNTMGTRFDFVDCETRPVAPARANESDTSSALQSQSARSNRFWERKLEPPERFFGGPGRTWFVSLGSVTPQSIVPRRSMGRLQ